MKKSWAWLLLLLSVSQWIGGNLCFELNYFIEESHRMNALEQEIANQLHEELGLSGNVQITEQEAATARGNIYSDFFLFSKEVNSKTIFFTLAEKFDAVALKTTHQPSQTPAQQPAKTAMLEHLFQPFVLPANGLSITWWQSKSVSNFVHTDSPDQFILSIPSPPPDHSC